MMDRNDGKGALCHASVVFRHSCQESLVVLLKQEQDEGNIRRYLEGLKKYRENGIPIIIDGVETEPDDWEEIAKVGEDGGFYMGDYIFTEEDSKDNTGKQRKLKEIRFDKVYYR